MITEFHKQFGSSVKMRKILIVDDDNELRAILSESLRGKGYYTEEASSGRDAIKRAISSEYDIILLELMMPTISGMDVLMEIRKFKPRTKVIIITGFATINNAVEAMKMGASGYISKPFSREELDTAIRRCLEEAKFDTSEKNLDLDFTIGSLSNPIRRKIIKLLYQNKGMNLTGITKTLDMKKHTKALFHLKMLQYSDIVEKDRKKVYFLTKEGVKTLNCLKILENNLPLRKRIKNNHKTKILGS
jgi:DNA-binding response OmpR family regulator